MSKAMIRIYARLIQKGRRTIDQIPKDYVEEVEKELEGKEVPPVMGA